MLPSEEGIPVTRDDFQIRFFDRPDGLVCRILYHGLLVAMAGGRTEDMLRLRNRMAAKAEKCIMDILSGQNRASLAVIQRLGVN